VAKTAAPLAAWQTASLEALDLVGLLIDGVHIGEHCLIVAGDWSQSDWRVLAAYIAARLESPGSRLSE
jgi:hypothetical protein